MTVYVDNSGVMQNDVNGGSSVPRPTLDCVVWLLCVLHQYPAVFRVYIKAKVAEALARLDELGIVVLMSIGYVCGTLSPPPPHSPH